MHDPKSYATNFQFSANFLFISVFKFKKVCDILLTDFKFLYFSHFQKMFLKCHILLKTLSIYKVF